MAYNSLNLKQAGWFYHAPAKRKDAPPVGAPPPSQIPGLNGVIEPTTEEERKRTWIKDSDSKYVVLAKQGGRPDLLRMRTPKPPPDKPVGYPRCDWYYLEDNAIEDSSQQPNSQSGEPYQFLLPDYMVHQPRRRVPPPTNTAAASGGNKPRRSVFHFDDQTAFERDANPTDKTQRIPEMRPNGYGVRMEKALAEEGPCAPPDYINQQPEHKDFRNHDPYANGWVMDEPVTSDHPREPYGEHVENEPQCAPRKTSPVRSDAKHTSQRQKSVSAHDKNNSRRPKEPFKMNKFKNVPSRVGSHRSPQPAGT